MANFKLEPENIKKMIEGAILAAELELVSKRAITVVPSEKGVMDAEYKTIVDSNETTRLQRPGSSFFQPSKVAFAYSSFPVFQDGRYVEMSDWEMAGDRDGLYKDTALSRTARMMAQIEDKIIMGAWYNSAGTAVSGATGYEASAGNTHAATATWITTGDPFIDVLTAIMTFGNSNFDVSDAGMRNVYLYCSPKRHVALKNIDSNGISSYKHIVDDLKIPGENILPSGNITATNAIVVYKNENYAKLVAPEEMFMFEPWQEGPTVWRWYIRNVFGLKIIDTNSVYKITGV